MSQVVCIDSNIFVWGIKKQASPKQEPNIQKAIDFLAKLDKQQTRVILPTPILTEMLSPVTDFEARDKFMDLIYSRFRIAPLDDVAAKIAGEIWSNTPSWKQYYTEGGDGIRNRFKYDILILGICKAQEVDCLYTEDDPLRKLAIANNIKASKIPIEQNLFTQPPQ